MNAGAYRNLALQHAADHAFYSKLIRSVADPHSLVDAAGLHELDVDEIRAFFLHQTNRILIGENALVCQNRSLHLGGHILHTLEIVIGNGLLHEFDAKTALPSQ